MSVGHVLLGTPGWLDVALVIGAFMGTIIAAGVMRDEAVALPGSLLAAFAAFLWPFALGLALLVGAGLGLYRLGGRFAPPPPSPEIADAMAELERELGSGEPRP